jgi:hypothetical protein
MNNLQALFTSQSDEWATPQDVYDSLDAEFHFTLDPCATDDNHKCEVYYTIDDNGLLQNWGGRQCSAILRTQGSASGLRKHIGRAEKITRLLFCSFRPERTRDTFTTSFTKERRSDLCEDELNLAIAKTLHRFRQW